MAEHIRDGRGIFNEAPPWGITGSNAGLVTLRDTSGTDINTDNPLPVSDEFGIPNSFCCQTSNANTFLIQKGQLNKYRLRPAIINEHAESSREVQGVVTSTNIVGQIFKASEDNINGIMLTLESAAFESIDDFESYANSAALQLVWVPSGNLNLIETTIVSPNAGSTQSMELPMDVLNNNWQLDLPAPADLTGFTADYDAYFEDTFANVRLTMVLGDDTNTKRFTVIQEDKNEWLHFEVNEGAFIEDGGTPVDTTAITFLRFEVGKKKATKKVYIDNLQQSPPPGEVELKLWDMGTEIPVGGVTSLDDGTQYTTLGDLGLNGGTVTASKILQLKGGKRLYTIKNFVAGVALEIPSNVVLNEDNFYAITINYVDTDTSVYGPNSSYEIDYYVNGYSFTAPDESTAITKLGTYKDCMFGIFSTQDAWMNTFIRFYNDADGATPIMGTDATENVFIEDKNMAITSIIAGENKPVPAIQVEFKDRYFYLPKGGKFEVYHNDDFGDSSNNVTMLIGYMHETPNPNS